MSIWKDLYDIFENERSRWQKKGANKQALTFEIQCNLGFLADALHSQLSQTEIIKRLEHSVFDQSISNGFSINSIRKKQVTDKTVGDFDEFKKYVNKDTEYLVKNSYSKIRSLSKLINANSNKDYSLRIKSLFRFLMLLVAHLEDRPLTKKPTNNTTCN